jgi:hypothetical protein
MMELLADTDRHHARPGGRVQIRADHVDLAIVLAEPHKRDLMLLRERMHRSTEPVADLFHQRR